MAGSLTKVMNNVWMYQRKNGTCTYYIRMMNPRTGKNEQRPAVPPKGSENGRKLTMFLNDEVSKMKRELAGGLSQSTVRTPFNDYFEGPFKSSFTGRGKTWDGYEGLCRRHIREWMGNLKLGDINKQILSDFFKYLDNEKHVGHSTYNAIYRLLHSVLNNAVYDDILLKNPLSPRGVKIKAVESKTRAMRPEELEELVRCLENEDLMWRTFYMLTISTGCRRGEMVGLMWEDVDLFSEYPCITVNHSVEYIPKKGVTVVEPKTPQSKRTVYIPGLVQDLLLEMYDGMHEGFVFPSRDDVFKPMHPDSVNRHTTLMCKKNNLQHFSLHTLRRTLATTLATRNKIDPKTLQTILGHSDVRTLLKYYVIPDDEVKKDAIEDYTRFFGTGEGLE